MTFHPGSSYESGDIGCQEEVAPPLRAGGGGNSIPGVWQPSEKTIAFSYGNSSDSRSMGEAEEVTPTIRAGGGGNSVPVVCHQEGRTSDLYSISGNIIGREAKNGGNHTGVASGEEPMYTLTTADLHAVCWTTPEGESSCLNPWETQSGRVFSQDGVFPTLTGGAKGERGYAGGCVLGSIPENAIGRPNSGTNGPMTYGPDEPSPTLTASSNVPAIAFNHNASASQGFAVSEELPPTLRTCNGNNSNMPTVLEPEAIDPIIVLNDQGGSRMDVSYDTAPTLRANSKGNEPIVMGSGQGKAGISEGLCPTQTARQYKDPPILFEKRKTNTLAFDTTQVTSAHNRSNPQWNGPCHTLSACGEAPSVFLSSDAGETGEARDEKDSRGFAQNTRNELRYIGGDGSLAGALAAQPGMKQQTFLESSFGVRRLTPVECERLQGFPDNWTRIEWNGKPEEQCPNSRRYKAIGNSMAVPVMAWIGKGLLAVQENMEES